MHHLGRRSPAPRQEYVPAWPPEQGWPAAATHAVKLGNVTFIPDKTLSPHALGLLVGASQIAIVFRQPEVTPVELVAAMTLGAARPFPELVALLKLDTLLLQEQILAYWLGRALPLADVPAEPPFSSALKELLGRAFAKMLQKFSVSPQPSVAPHDLLLALLNEPSEPLRGWLADQQQNNPEFAAALLEATEDSAAYNAGSPPMQSAESGPLADQEHRLGQLLLEAGRLTPEQLETALARAQHTGKRLGEALIELQLVDEDHVQALLARLLGIDEIDLYSELVEAETARMIGEEVLRRHATLPVRIEGDSLIVAMVDPLNLQAIDEIRLSTGLNVVARITTSHALKFALHQIFGGPA